MLQSESDVVVCLLKEAASYFIDVLLDNLAEAGKKALRAIIRAGEAALAWLKELAEMLGRRKRSAFAPEIRRLRRVVSTAKSKLSRA